MTTYHFNERESKGDGDIMTIEEFIELKIVEAEKTAEYVPDELGDIAEKVRQTYKTDCIVEYIGGFDSPGYVIDCYAFAYVDTDGKAGIYGYRHETY